MPFIAKKLKFVQALCTSLSGSTHSAEYSHIKTNMLKYIRDALINVTIANSNCLN